MLTDITPEIVVEATTHSISDIMHSALEERAHILADDRKRFVGIVSEGIGTSDALDRLPDHGVYGISSNLTFQPSAIACQGTFKIENFQSKSNNLELFVDASGHLCVKGPDGVVSYVVLSTVPPETGAQIIPPSYEAKSKEPVLVVISNKISAPITLWDHLQDEEF